MGPVRRTRLAGLRQLSHRGGSAPVYLNQGLPERINHVLRTSGLADAICSFSSSLRTFPSAGGPPPPAGTLPWRSEREALLAPTATLGSDGLPGSQLGGATSQLGGASQLATSVGASLTSLGGSQLPPTPQEGGQGGSQAKELSKEAVLQVGSACMSCWYSTAVQGPHQASCSTGAACCLQPASSTGR